MGKFMKDKKIKKQKLTKEQKKALILENKNKVYLSQLIKPIAFFVLAFATEILTNVLLKIKNSNGNAQILPTYLFFDIGIWLIISGLIMICSKKWLCNFIFYFTIILQIAISMVNSILYPYFGYYFTWDLIVLAGQGAACVDTQFINITNLLILAVLMIVAIVTPIIIDACCKNKKFETKKLSKPIIMLVAFFTFFVLGSTSYSVQALTLKSSTNPEYEAIESDKFLYKNMHILEESYRKFGVAGFYTKNLYDLTLGNLFLPNKNETFSQIKAGEVGQNPNAKLAGDNLIVIMLESFEWFAIDPYNTPNLWRMKTGEGSTSNPSSVPGKSVVINNYISNNKTNVSEDAVILGYMPKVNQITFFGNNNLATAYSLPNLFKNQDYSVNFFHNYVGYFYQRENVNIEMGFDNVYAYEDTNGEKFKFGDWRFESDFLDQMISKIAPTDTKFMSFYTTVATHGEYNGIDRFIDKYQSKYNDNLSNYKQWLSENGYVYPQDDEYQNYLKNYKLAVMDTDEMIGKLFTHLTQNNLLDKTTVMVYADHNAYYNNLSNYIKGTPVSDQGNLKTHNVPFMIYNPKLGSKEIDVFCNTYDIYPTICELYGLNYSTFFTQGYNIFSEDIKNSTYVSYLTGYYSSTCYSKTMTNIALYNDNVTSEDVKTFKDNVCKYINKQIMIENVYKSNWKVNK